MPAEASQQSTGLATPPTSIAGTRTLINGRHGLDSKARHGQGEEPVWWKPKHGGEVSSILAYRKPPLDEPDRSSCTLSRGLLELPFWQINTADTSTTTDTVDATPQPRSCTPPVTGPARALTPPSGGPSHSRTQKETSLPLRPIRKRQLATQETQAPVPVTRPAATGEAMVMEKHARTDKPHAKRRKYMRVLRTFEGPTDPWSQRPMRRWVKVPVGASYSGPPSAGPSVGNTVASRKVGA